MDSKRISLSSGSGSNDEEKFDSNGNLEQAIYEVDERTRLIGKSSSLVISYSDEDSRCTTIEPNKQGNDTNGKLYSKSCNFFCLASQFLECH